MKKTKTRLLICFVALFAWTGVVAAQSAYDVQQGTTVKGSFAVGDARSVTGAASGDVVVRAENQKIFLSADAGTTAHAVLDTQGFLGLGTSNPQRRLHLIGPESFVASFPSAGMGPRDLLVLENNNNANLSFIAGGTGYQTIIRFLKSGDGGATGWISYMHGDNHLIVGTGGAERMRITGAGNIGFGVAPISGIHHYSNTSANPTTAAIPDVGGKDGLLTLNGTAAGVAGGGGGILFGGYGPANFFAGIKSLLTNGGGNTTGDLAFATRNDAADPALTERMRITGAGRIGIGVAAPISALHHYTNTGGNPLTAAIADGGPKDGLLTLNAAGQGVAGGGGGILFGGNGPAQFFAGIKSLLANGGGNTTGDLAFATRNDAADLALTERMRITGAGRVGIGTPNPQYTLHVNGTGRFEDGVSAVYQDVAEWVPATDALSAGTVVVIDRSAPNRVTASTTAYDTAVAGVISAQPGLLLGVEGPDKVRVATTGRVKVRADASDGPIAIGDLLVTSKTAGAVMRSEPMTMNGRTFHQPGTLVGKALEPLEKGSGEILVLLSLQ